MRTWLRRLDLYTWTSDIHDLERDNQELDAGETHQEPAVLEERVRDVIAERDRLRAKVASAAV